ncbi:MAG: BstYI [Chloroflexi bacterium]|nr:BstYI [Chloroflexota bacterium]
MKVVYEYSHLGGAEIMQVRYSEWNSEIYQTISGVRARRSKISEEKTKRGRALFSPIDMNAQFKRAFAARGYQELRDNYTITIPGSTVSIPGTFKQVDFVKAKLLVEVQFGKYAFMFYDLAKFQYFFNENKCDVGIEIVPCREMKHQMSGGVSYGEQLVYDIERQNLNFPLVPIKLILIDAGG